MDLKRRRIRVLVDTWSEIFRQGLADRESVIKLLEAMYKEAGVEPIRGASTPPDLYDKEMISLYIIGKWGLGIDKDLDKEFVEKVFSKELLLERIIELVEKLDSFDEVCREIGEDICKSIDSGFVARLLRFAFTLMYFGFKDEEWFKNFMKKFYRIAPQFEDTIRRFARFYIAFRIGYMIERGELKTRMDINIAKNMAALELSIPHCVPSNSYIAEVAKHYFVLPHRILNELTSKRREAESNTF